MTDKNNPDKDLHDAFLKFIERRNIDRNEIIFENYNEGNPITSVDKKQAINSIVSLCDDMLADGDIAGVRINQDNLNKYNKANMLACVLFNPSNPDFKFPQQNLSFAEARVYTDRVEFEK